MFGRDGFEWGLSVVVLIRDGVQENRLRWRLVNGVLGLKGSRVRRSRSRRGVFWVIVFWVGSLFGLWDWWELSGW